MKYKRNEKLIVYMITYGPKGTRSLLGDTAPLKDSLPPKLSKKLSPRNIYHFKYLPTPNIRGLHTLKLPQAVTL